MFKDVIIMQISSIHSRWRYHADFQDTFKMSLSCYILVYVQRCRYHADFQYTFKMSLSCCNLVYVQRCRYHADFYCTFKISLSFRILVYVQDVIIMLISNICSRCCYRADFQCEFKMSLSRCRLLVCWFGTVCWYVFDAVEHSWFCL